MQKYFNLEGTSTRSEYWEIQLLTCLVLFIASSMLLSAELIVLGYLLMLAACWCNVATTVRRIRDSGNSLWWILVYVVPYISFIALVVFGVLETKTEAE